MKTHLPYLELLDGVRLAVLPSHQRSLLSVLSMLQVPVSSSVVSAAPLMRPLTPASVGPSMRQVEHQLMDADLELETYQSGLAARCGEIPSPMEITCLRDCSLIVV